VSACEVNEEISYKIILFKKLRREQKGSEVQSETSYGQTTGFWKHYFGTAPNGQEGGLEPLGRSGPLLTRFARLRWRSLERTGRDDRSGLEALETKDLVFQFLDAVLETANDIEQLPHERGAF
jgi:hypothetical protein